MKSYHVDHIIRALNPMFKGVSFEQREFEIIFTWGIHHCSVIDTMLEDDGIGDIDIARYIGKCFVDLSMVI